MPPKNMTRTTTREDYLADRVASLREAEGMSYEGLARRMTEVGCPIQASAIYKTEKGTPRRRIVVDELMAYARVFRVSLDYLVAMPGETETQQAHVAVYNAYNCLGDHESAKAALAKAESDFDNAAEAAIASYKAMFAALDQLEAADVEAVFANWRAPADDELRVAYARHQSEAKKRKPAPRTRKAAQR